MAQAVDDRRIFDRFMARFPVKFKDSRHDFGSEVFLRDISASGAKILSRERLYLNDHVALLVKLPDGGDPFPLSGEVVWSKNEEENPRAWDCGIQFPAVHLMMLQRLFKFCVLDG